MIKRKVCLVILAALLGLIFAGPAFSQEEAGEFSVSPMAGAYWFDNEQDIEQGWMGTIGLGYNLTDNIATELVGSYGQCDKEHFDPATCTCKTEDVDAYKIHLDGIYNFMPSSRLVPYIAAGVGGVRVDDETENDDYTMVNYGGGIKYFLSEDFAIRGDVRHVYDVENSRNNAVAMVGLVFQFGGKEKPVVEEKEEVSYVPEPAPEPEHVYVPEVAPTPAPKPAPAPEPVPEPSSAPPPVEEPKEILSIDLNIQFDLDKDVVKRKYHDRIKKLADFMKSHPDTLATIEGHTCNLGSDQYNLDLSQQRATAVRLYLIENFSIAPTRIRARGYGESRPIADNSTEVGRETNRRVMVVVTNADSNNSRRDLLKTSKDAIALFESDLPSRTFNGVSVKRRNGNLRVSILADTPVLNFNSFTLDSPNRVVIDLPGRWKNKSASLYSLDDRNIRRIRVGTHSDHLRIVLDIDGPLTAPAIGAYTDGLMVRFATSEGISISRR